VTSIRHSSGFRQIDQQLLAGTFEHRSTFLNRHEAVRLKFTLVENWTQGITQFSQNGRMLNQFRDIHSNSVLLEFIGKKGEGDSIVSEFYLANGKQMVKQVLPGFDSNKIVPWWRFSTILRTVSNPRPDLDPLV